MRWNCDAIADIDSGLTLCKILIWGGIYVQNFRLILPFS